MDQEKKFNREEISRIIKIASDLSQNPARDEEKLSTEELQKLAMDVGINPEHIKTAILQLKNDDFETSSLTDGSLSYYDSRIIDGSIDDARWEKIVATIRNINGGIGRTQKLGNTYEWEQRKRKVGYLQVSVTPKKEYSRLQVNANYQTFSNFLGALSGAGGFALFSILSSNIPAVHGVEAWIGVIGAAIGWGASRIYLKSWIRNKQIMLQSLTQRLSVIITKSAQRTGLKTRPKTHEIVLDGTENESEHTAKRNPERLQN